jgi:predicted Rossmann fold flavoprotein
VGARHAGRPGLIDALIVGGSAAGLATAIFLKQSAPALRVRIFEGARRPGAKILVSGGSRCNVTNRVVSERDFHGSTPGAIRRVLRALPVEETIALFASWGVPLHEEAHGKMFPDSQRSRDVLDALLRQVHSLGAELVLDARVEAVAATAGGFEVRTRDGATAAGRAIVMATGGLALPKSGSDGAGLEFVRQLGHSIVPTTPALVPLLLEPGPRSLHQDVQGVSHEAELILVDGGRVSRRVQGSLLWTHFGISGPAALDVSRHWLRARLEGRSPRLLLSFHPAESFEAVDAWWTTAAAARPRTGVAAALSERVPASVSEAIVRRLEIRPEVTLAALTRAERRRLVHALTGWDLPVTGSQGYVRAEATAGGVPLAEVDTQTMESRRRPGLYLAGEILDVDGRLGGFNFQWAWASGRAAARGLARRYALA